MAHQSALRVASCPLQIGEIDRNRRVVSDAIRAAARRGAEIIVVPELAVSGYVFASEAEARTLAEPADSPTVRGWLDLARELGVVIVGGLCELDSGGVLRNSAVLVDRAGSAPYIARPICGIVSRFASFPARSRRPSLTPSSDDSA